MTRPLYTTLLLAIALGSSVLLGACGGSGSGNAVAPGTGNFVIENLDNETVHVFASGSEIGTVGPGAKQDFSINDGNRTVEFRETGSTFRTSHGAYSFDAASTLELRYDPGFAFNLRVTNQRADTVEVFADLVNYGSVGPGLTVEFRIETGRRELAFRRTGSTTADFFDVYNFNHTDLVDVTTR
ncbi:MAG: hypothetical protein JKY65_22040 [Planctomycetes bacterium]|nr:hypothetical protein [Planctomycetota bacterium]